uniref:Uncharacterized protein n=1 Tax=Tanacetum cinerariifolium TaxID=118510 RepID=A0A699H1R9_TANCI|nr:hypothetical protein [Tanacetum cinerariifolium]
MAIELEAYAALAQLYASLPTSLYLQWGTSGLSLEANESQETWKIVRVFGAALAEATTLEASKNRMRRQVQNPSGLPDS